MKVWQSSHLSPGHYLFWLCSYRCAIDEIVPIGVALAVGRATASVSAVGRSFVTAMGCRCADVAFGLSGGRRGASGVLHWDGRACGEPSLRSA